MAPSIATIKNVVRSFQARLPCVGATQVPSMSHWVRCWWRGCYDLGLKDPEMEAFRAARCGSNLVHHDSVRQLDLSQLTHLHGGRNRPDEHRLLVRVVPVS
jgi:hypothetical protein